MAIGARADSRPPVPQRELSSFRCFPLPCCRPQFPQFEGFRRWLAEKPIGCLTKAAEDISSTGLRTAPRLPRVALVSCRCSLCCRKKRRAVVGLEKGDGLFAVSLQLCFDYAIAMRSTTSLVQESTSTMVSSPQRKYFIGQPPSTTMMSGGKS
jgi:hypothetical protein